MQKLTRDDLYSLEKYSAIRKDFRAEVMAHKKPRRIAIGAHANLYFEDRMTMQYQIQEMLRIERIFEAEAIQEELDAYNPLIPDGSNWKATFMIEYGDPEVRKVELAKLIGIEQAVWVQIDGFDRVTPISNEDLERTTEEKTSSVHFMRIELSPAMASAAKAGAAIRMGIDHPNYQGDVILSDDSRHSLVSDLE
ncbi:MAG: DUF3501 family protein [Gammaproteobacteria bacterium]|nr:DUF3501 family protein [Gammaproteobacteria bacterium]MCP5135677.1 DUF3501 family protein [Gammaproteobacteria bacterium]